MPSAPIDLDEIKDDLGIPANDTSNDAWLRRRIDGIWARFEVYCGRPLQLSSDWLDDWGAVITNHPAYTEPPLLRAPPSATVFLRVFPVQAIYDVIMTDGSVVPARLLFQPSSGKLIGLDTPGDLRMSLLNASARITYQAGFEQIPADLYEALLGVLHPMWSARQAQASGATGLATRISTTDVGEVEFSQSPNVFVDASIKRGNITDPLLGPYAMLLDAYVDWRSMIGGAYPSTIVAPTRTNGLVGQLDFSKRHNSQYIPLI